MSRFEGKIVGGERECQGLRPQTPTKGHCPFEPLVKGRRELERESGAENETSVSFSPEPPPTFCKKLDQKLLVS